MSKINANTTKKELSFIIENFKYDDYLGTRGNMDAFGNLLKK